MLGQKMYIKLIIILALAFFGFALVFPSPFNKTIACLNKRVLHYTGIKAPFFPVVPFKLGLDLQGGSYLVYEADLSKVAKKDWSERMQGLRDVIERRINFFGVREPVVRIEEGGGRKKLVVELAGVKDVDEAIKMIGETPLLEFRREAERENSSGTQKEEMKVSFVPTKLTGQYLKKARLDINQTTLEPQVLLEFDKEGAKIFRQLTAENVGKRLAIYIDNVLISAPRVQEEIKGGKAQITGRFTLEEAKKLVRNLNAGALPVPIKLISQTTIGPVLGRLSLEKSLKAAVIGFLAVAVFMILFYRVSGFFASLSLLLYGLILLSLFKLIPITLTLAGIGGAILSVGMAVDANVLIFERQKEERKAGESFARTISIGFSRAWPSIRDSNFTTLLVALIMFSFGTSFVKGFALTLGLGILVSLFSALFVTKTLLTLFVDSKIEKIKWFWV